MALRQMVGTRKGGGLPTVPTNAAGADATTNATDSGTPDDSDVVKCPNCDCEFNESTLDVVKPGKPVEDAGQGPDLDGADSVLPTPGHLGAAHDAAYGDGIIGNVLDSLRTRMK